MSDSGQAPSRGQIPSLDGIRAVAVSLVFFAHSGLENIVPGGFGVTIFFVLSGYLITTLMRMEYAQYRVVSYRAFYLRRGLRLMPPLLVATIAAGLLSWAGIIYGDFSLQGLLSVLFYLGNYFVIAHDFQGVPHGTGVVWSLAVEEHYYLLYPPLAVLLLRLNRRLLVLITLVGLCFAVLLWRMFLFSQGASEAYLTMATDTRIDAILVGCLMAMLFNPWLDPVLAPHRGRDWAIVVACLAVLAGTLLYRNEAFRLTLRYSLQSLAVAPLIYLAVARPQNFPFRWLNARPMTYIGSVSYSIYLIHQLMLGLIAKQWPTLGWFGVTMGALALTLMAAEPMRRWVEQPCARLRQRLHQSTPKAKDEFAKHEVASAQ